jgi:hypothetical protein
MIRVGTLDIGALVIGALDIGTLNSYWAQWRQPTGSSPP